MSNTIAHPSPSSGGGAAARVEDGPKVRADEDAASTLQAAKVLVVEDNLDAAEMLALLLQLEGRDPVLAHDGRSALQLALAERPSIALLDMRLPDMNGRELADRLRASLGAATPRLIAMSGLEPGPEGIPVVFDAWLLKPFDLEQLQQALEAAQRAPSALA